MAKGLETSLENFFQHKLKLNLFSRKAYFREIIELKRTESFIQSNLLPTTTLFYCFSVRLKIYLNISCAEIER